MGCGEFRQVRIGEFLEFGIDTSGNVTSPLDLSDAIDLAGAGNIALTITINSADLN